MRNGLKIQTTIFFSLLASVASAAQVDDCRIRNVPVIVRKPGGLPVDDLSPADFVAKQKGKTVEIGSIVPGAQPHRVVMMLDTSGSMNSATRFGEWKLAIEILDQFASAFASHGQLAFLTFDAAVHQKLDFSQGNGAVLAHLKKMKDGEIYGEKDIHGRTALFDAIQQGVYLFGTPSASDVILVVTDGGENASKLKQEDLERELLRTGVRFYAVLLYQATPGNRARTPEELQGPETLKDLATNTGGEVFGPMGYRAGSYLLAAPWELPEGQDLNVGKTLDVFYEGLFHLKMVNIELPKPAKKGAKLELKLSESGRQKWKSATVKYPEKILPCEATIN